MSLNSSQRTLRAGRGGVRRVRGEEAQRVVAPVVRQAALGQGRLGGERLHRQQLDAGHAQRGEVTQRRGVGQAGVRAAQLLGHVGVAAGQVAHVRLVEHRLGPRHQRGRVVPPVVGVRHDDAPGHVRRAVAPVAHVGVAAQLGVDPVPEHLGAPGHVALDRPGVGVEQQLVRVVAHALGRTPRAAHPQGVALTGADARDEAEPRAVGALLEPDGAPGVVRRCALVEEHQVDPVGVPGVEGEVDPVVVQRGAERRGKVTAGAHGPQRRQSLR